MANNLDLNGIDLLGDAVPLAITEVHEDLNDFTIRNMEIPAEFKVNSDVVKIIEILQCKVKSIRFIKKYFNAEILIIKNSDIKDIKRIKKCTKLKMLILDNANITNLSFLRNMDELERLDLMNCNIKDVRQIKKCKKLKKLTFNQDEMNNIKGMDELKRNPELTIARFNNIG